MGDSDAVKAFLAYTYFGKMDKAQVGALLTIADKYLITRLREACFAHMIAEKDPVLALTHVQTLRRFKNDPNCKEAARKLISIIRAKDVKEAFMRETLESFGEDAKLAPPAKE